MATKKQPANRTTKKIPTPPPLPPQVEDIPAPPKTITKVSHYCVSKSDKFVDKLQLELNTMLADGWKLMSQSHSVGDAGMGRAYSVLTVYCKDQ
jgi:hypothetical protein